MTAASRLRIAVVYGHPFGQGGVETHLLSILRRGDRERFSWTFFGEASDVFAAKVAALGAEIVPWRARRALDLPAAFRLGRLLRRHGADVIHVHSARAHVLARIAALRLRRPVVATVHMRAGQPVAGRGLRVRLRHVLYGIVESWLVRRAGRVVHVCAADHLRGVAEGAAADQTVFIENGIDLDRFPPAADRRGRRAALGVPAEAVVLACVARLDPQKGLDVLIEAAAHLRGTFELWMIGDGPLEATLREQARARGIAGRMRWLGAREDVPALLAAADVFVLPSRFETSSIALLEGMAAGLPVVATDVGDTGRLVGQGRAGRIVAPDDAAALAAALQDFIDAPAERLRFAAAAVHEARQHSDVQMVARLQTVYEALTPPAGRP